MLEDFFFRLLPLAQHSLGVKGINLDLLERAVYATMKFVNQVDYPKWFGGLFCNCQKRHKAAVGLCWPLSHFSSLCCVSWSIWLLAEKLAWSRYFEAAVEASIGENIVRCIKPWRFLERTGSLLKVTQQIRAKLIWSLLLSSWFFRPKPLLSEKHWFCS